MTTQRTTAIGRAGAVIVILASIAIIGRDRPAAQGAGPEMLNSRLTVAPLVSGLTTPIGLAFLGRNDLFVIEKDTGRVLRVQNGAPSGTVLDLGVNNNSERGLLGIALHPRFPIEPFVISVGPAAPLPRRPIRSSQSMANVSTRTCSCPTATTSCRCRCSATASIGSCGTARR